MQAAALKPGLYALIMSGQMLLEWLGRKRGAARALDAWRHIEAAVERVIEDSKFLTPDLGGSAKTSEMGDAIADAIHSA
jgi:3-isopropylmalate dehydrogenase